MDVLIIAPEITKGMKSIGSKALLKIKQSISVIEYQINEIKKYNSHNKITIVSGFEHDKISKLYSNTKNINIVYNPEYTNTNHGESLSVFLDQMNPGKNLLVITNGVLFKNNPFKSKINNNLSQIYCINKPKTNFDIGYIGDTSIEYLFFDLPNKWTECVMFNQEALSLIRNIDKQKISQMYLFEIINLLIEKKIIFNIQTSDKKYFMKINNAKDISKAKVFI
jgi:bifunctional N-acetylglucosamine-1-phosphate-uridyltransferase/glucosamine-1-phosphate-acetyltransferase GlmU-like protein